MKSKEQAHIFTRNGEKLKSPLSRTDLTTLYLSTDSLHPHLDQKILVSVNN